MNDELYTGLAQVAAALANPTRLRALNLLFQGPKSIEALAELLGESHANTAAHMKSLRAAGLVSAERQGKYTFQAATAATTLRLFLALREAAETVTPSVRLLREAADKTASAVDPTELEKLVQARRVVLLDLRPEPEFKLGHLPGARSLPASAIKERAPELPASRRILAYCRGKYCPSARDGVESLRKAGLRAERLAFGVPEWRAEGRAVETESAS